MKEKDKNRRNFSPNINKISFPLSLFNLPMIWLYISSEFIILNNYFFFLFQKKHSCSFGASRNIKIIVRTEQCSVPTSNIINMYNLWNPWFYFRKKHSCRCAAPRNMKIDPETSLSWRQARVQDDRWDVLRRQ